MGNKETLADLVGSYDNLNEPIPLSNRPETILGISISFQVRTYAFKSYSSDAHEPCDTIISWSIKSPMCWRKSNLFTYADPSLDKWAFAIVDALSSNQGVGMG